jgi:hypothetical protein
MADWSSYTLSDFLLFSPRTYERLFVLVNQDVWPAQLASLAYGAALMLMIVRGNPLAARAALAGLALAWLFVCGVFFLGRYQAINWLGGSFAGLAALQAVGLALLAIFDRRGLLTRRQAPLAHDTGIALLVLGLLVYPLLEPLLGRSLAGAQVFAVAADPTAVASLGLAALLKARTKWLAMFLPALWCVFTGLTLWTLERFDFFVPPAAAAIALIGAVWPRPQSRTSP